MRLNCMSKALRFLQITAKQQDFSFLTAFLTMKISISKHFSRLKLKVTAKVALILLVFGTRLDINGF